ncbi:MAG: hypothetical protein ACYC3V_01810 [Chloroflexota bacterium]
MGLAEGVTGFARLRGLGGLRSQFDFDAPGLATGEQLDRLRYAAEQAIRQCDDEVAADELAFALADCRALLGMGSLEGEAAWVAQRVQRIRRVVTYHEGWLARWNRRYWWAACAGGVLVMVVCWVRCVPWL